MVLVVHVHAPLPAKAWPRRGSIADKASPKRLLVLRLAACGRVGLSYEARAASRSIVSPGYDQSAKWPFQGGRTHCDRLNWRFRVPLAAGDWLAMHGAAPTLASGHGPIMPPCCARQVFPANCHQPCMQKPVEELGLGCRKSVSTRVIRSKSSSSTHPHPRLTHRWTRDYTVTPLGCDGASACSSHVWWRGCWLAILLGRGPPACLPGSPAILQPSGHVFSLPTR